QDRFLFRATAGLGLGPRAEPADVAELDGGLGGEFGDGQAGHEGYELEGFHVSRLKSAFLRTLPLGITQGRRACIRFGYMRFYLSTCPCWGSVSSTSDNQERNSSGGAKAI